MDDIEALRASMKATLSVPIPDHYSERTKAEHRAGRERLVKNIAESAGEVGRDELCRRFGERAIRSVSVDCAEDGVWHASAWVRCATKQLMRFDEPLLSFPSEFMIAQLALVV